MIDLFNKSRFAPTSLDDFPSGIDSHDTIICIYLICNGILPGQTDSFDRMPYNNIYYYSNIFYEIIKYL